ncbi:Putative serine/threonine-protein kinase, active [Septoria linicola]|uniref:Serine/threonine-protein kinase, active n=1 Tax=Septoria linicola TaxID=215465 RepID=A0A9Q9EJP0_9PEZI|nr:putative serine/threonine-protein kinase, active [Septoria linicola]USW53971.1 Putative serine/threonine-protein kinase, active [Septoria linicola]
MAPATSLPRSYGSELDGSPRHRPRSRPQPLRVRTFSESNDRSPGFDENRQGLHTRHKSISSTIDNAALSPRSPSLLQAMIEEEGEELIGSDLSPRTSLDTVFSDVSTIAGSPVTPLTNLSSARTSIESPGPAILPFDFSKIDYELERAKVLGEGLWSTVYLAEQKASKAPSSPSLPRRLFRKPRAPSAPLLFAVKTPARQDAKEVFLQEARILSHLQRRSSSRMYIVPFYGLDDRCDSLVFEAVIGGSLDDLCSRLRQMTEVARHLEVISLFPGIAYDLIAGLEFLHANGVVHADIKSGNVLLDISQHASQQKPVIRARYIDFSAAFIPAENDGATNAGGTWDFMAPEQLRIQKEFNTPTPASDIWSLGITLLSIMVGGSPYTAACGGNNFMLREAIKSGDPLGFARMDPVPRKRLTACQDFVDCCRLALKKDRENRITASAWKSWLEDCEWVDGDLWSCTGQMWSPERSTVY